MEYLNLFVAVTRSPEYVGSDPTQRGTWLNLSAYCATVENGGVIAGCREWKDRRCQQTLGVTRSEMLGECELWWWEGDDLHVAFYPAEQEAKVIAKRSVARNNGKLGGRPKKTQLGSDIGTDIGTKIGTHGKPSLVPTLEPKSEPTLKPISESVKEGKEKEGKGNTTTTAGAREALQLPLPDHERLINAYARPSFDRGALEAAEHCLRRYAGKIDFAEILAAVNRVTVAVALWTEDERAVFLPTAANFFREDGWRKHPDEWASRREAKKRTNGRGPGSMSQDEINEALGGRAAS